MGKSSCQSGTVFSWSTKPLEWTSVRIHAREQTTSHPQSWITVTELMSTHNASGHWQWGVSQGSCEVKTYKQHNLLRRLAQIFNRCGNPSASSRTNVWGINLIFHYDAIWYPFNPIIVIKTSKNCFQPEQQGLLLHWSFIYYSWELFYTMFMFCP